MLCVFVVHKGAWWMLLRCFCCCKQSLSLLLQIYSCQVTSASGMLLRMDHREMRNSRPVQAVPRLWARQVQAECHLPFSPLAPVATDESRETSVAQVAHSKVAMLFSLGCTTTHPPAWDMLSSLSGSWGQVLVTDGTVGLRVSKDRCQHGFGQENSPSEGAAAMVEVGLLCLSCVHRCTPMSIIQPNFRGQCIEISISKVWGITLSHTKVWARYHPNKACLLQWLLATQLCLSVSAATGRVSVTDVVQGRRWSSSQVAENHI